MCRCRDTARIAFGEALVTDAALREIATADRERTSAFERKAQLLIASHRGSSPVVFVSHRPNIDLLSLELIGEGELLVARANENGELTVLGKIHLDVFAVNPIAYNGHRYGIIFTDEVTHMRWGATFKLKNKAFQCVKNLNSLMETQYGIQIKGYRLDGVKGYTREVVSDCSSDA